MDLNSKEPFDGTSKDFKWSIKENSFSIESLNAK